MPLIKSNQSAPPAARDALALDLCDLQEQATQMMKTAERDAARVRALAEEEARRLIDAADARGYAAGLERGLAEGRAQGRVDGRDESFAEYKERLETLETRWSETLERWEENFGAMLLAAREDVLTFAFAMARKIVLRTPVVDPGVVQEQLVETLGLLCRPASVTIEIHPDDRALVDETLPSLIERAACCEHAKIRENDSITPGGCIVRTGEGVIDATLETQIERIATTLLPAASASNVSDRAGANARDADADGSAAETTP